jgi:hypothetical protein
MTRDDAKKILALYRPGVTDDADPQTAAALDLAQRDPELAAWFEQQRAVFDAIRGKLKAIPVPQGLRRQILARHAAEAREPESRIIPLRNRWLLVSAAAALLLLTAIIWTQFGSNSRYAFDNYRDRMGRMVQRGYFMQMFGTNQADIRAFFASKGASVDYVLPANLNNLPGEGGVVLDWHKKQVCLLCLNGATKPGVPNDLYLFMASRSAIPDAPAPGQRPQFKPVNRLMTVTWTVGDRVFLLAGKGDEATLQKYLE